MSMTMILESSGNDEKDDGDSFLRYMLQAFKGKEYLRRATSLKNLRSKILDIPTSDEKRIIQIIGHALPGRISVGGIGSFKATPNDFLYLDSDAYNYGTIKTGVTPKDEVWLLGCYAGSDAYPSPYIATGSVLLFDLSRMWKCTVRGALDAFTYDDFDDDGLFRGEMATAGPWITLDQSPGDEATNWTVRYPATDLTFKGTQTDLRVELTKLLDTPSRANLRANAIRDELLPEEEERLRRHLQEQFSLLLDPPLGEVGAVPEFLFEAKLAGQSGRAEVLLNATVLRFRPCGGGVPTDFLAGPPIGDHAPPLGAFLDELLPRRL